MNYYSRINPRHQTARVFIFNPSENGRAEREMTWSFSPICALPLVINISGE